MEMVIREEFLLVAEFFESYISASKVIENMGVLQYFHREK